MTQKILKLRALPLDGEAEWKREQRERELNKPVLHVSEEKQLADLLKRQSRHVMRDVTECEPHTLPAHLARLDDLRERIAFALHHELQETAENKLSGDQLLHPNTLADYLAAMAITRQQHRAPSFLNRWHEELAAVNHKLDLLAGLFAHSKAIERVLAESEAA